MATRGSKGRRAADSGGDDGWKPLPRALFTPVEAPSIVFFRVAFGLLMAWKLRHYVWGDNVQFLTRPPLLFKFHGFAWVAPGPEWAMKLLFWVLFFAALGIAVGLFYRISAAVFCVGEFYVLLLDTSRYNNHDYLICLIALLLVFIPAHRSGSLDAALSPRIRSRTLPAWTLWLLRFQIAVPYFFGGLAKLNGDWLLRAQPMTLWLERGGAKVPELLQSKAAGYFFSWGGLLFDLLIVPLLLYRRTRLPSFLLAVGFHLTNAVIWDIGVFPWLMICATTLFFAPDWPRRVGLVKRRHVPAGGRRTRDSEGLTPWQRTTLALVALYVGVQVVVPFRHFLYPGNVDWTEEGSRFAWRMKLRDKHGEVRLMVLDKRSRKATIYDDLDTVLTKRQYQHLVHDPEMILQLAHFLATELEAQGRADFEVRALTSLSLNAREPRPIIDPEVDLTTRRRGVGADWILPLNGGDGSARLE